MPPSPPPQLLQARHSSLLLFCFPLPTDPADTTQDTRYTLRIVGLSSYTQNLIEALSYTSSYLHTPRWPYCRFLPHQRACLRGTLTICERCREQEMQGLILKRGGGGRLGSRPAQNLTIYWLGATHFRRHKTKHNTAHTLTNNSCSREEKPATNDNPRSVEQKRRWPCDGGASTYRPRSPDGPAGM